MTMPKIGDAAPQFDLADQDGRKHKLADFAGKNVVLYFYPKDDTPGCTVEACAFRDDHSKLEAAGAVVLGVSPDDSKSHRKFADKFSLNFPLLADTDHRLAEAYGAWGEKSNYGRTYMGIIRSTFLIGPDGKIAHVWPKVKAAGHSDQVLAKLTGQEPAKKASSKKTRPDATSSKKVTAKAVSAAKAPVKAKPAQTASTEKKAAGRATPAKKKLGAVVKQAKATVKQAKATMKKATVTAKKATATAKKRATVTAKKATATAAKKATTATRKVSAKVKKLSTAAKKTVGEALKKVSAKAPAKKSPARAR